MTTEAKILNIQQELPLENFESKLYRLKHTDLNNAIFAMSVLVPKSQLALVILSNNNQNKEKYKFPVGLLLQNASIDNWEIFDNGINLTIKN